MKKNKLIFYLRISVFSFLFSTPLFSQLSYTQKLEKFLEKRNITTSQIDSLNRNIDTFLFSNGTVNPNLLEQLLKIENVATDLHYPTGEADAKFNMARHYMLDSKTAKAMKYFFNALSIDDKNNDTNRLARTKQQIGLVYYQQKNYISALRFFIDASDYYKHTHLEQKQSQCYYLLGIVNRDLKNYDSAEYFFRESIELKLKTKDNKGLTQSYMEMANMFIVEHLPDSAIAMINKSIFYANDYKNDHSFITRKYNIEAQAYLLQNRPEPAEESAKTCLKEARLSGRTGSLCDAYQICYRVASVLKNYKEAFEFQNRYLLLKESVYSEEIASELMRVESNSRIEKIQTEKKLLEEQNKLKSKLNYSFVFGLVLLLLVTLLLLNRNRIKERTNGIITKQKNLVDKKNLEITQSINYAKRIQNAILPPNKLIKQHMEHSFILYKPKDIVAGDFYWLEQVSHENGERRTENTQLLTPDSQLILFAACDCTGHGVPGALVSVVCHNALNRAVREFGLTQPAAILDKTADLVIENFSKGDEEINDGMDISLCSYNPATKELQWAGANNPLWIVRRLENGEWRMENGQELNNKLPNSNSVLPTPLYELIETIADKQPIGQDIYRKPFTNHTFTLNPGDTVYLFTDGYADQFGGPTGQKKLTRRRFKELILSLQTHPLKQQGIEMDTFITAYRNNEEQIDDILVMGFRV